MSNIRIKFNIENLNTGQFENAWGIEGGLLIEKNGIILTKRVDDPYDNGYRGDYIFYNLFDWLTSLPKLISGKACECQLIDSVETFIFKPKDELTCFKYFIEGMGQLVERENYRYPNHEDGTPMKTNELVLEIVEVSEKFLGLLESKIKDKSDMEDFKQAIFDAKEAYKSCFGD